MHKILKNNFNYLSAAIVLSLSVFLPGCTDGGNARNSADDAATAKVAQNSAAKVQSSTGGGVINLSKVDLSSLNYNLGSAAAASCSSGNAPALCAQLTKAPGATYVNNTWVMPRVVVGLTLNFKQNISHDFHLANIVSSTNPHAIYQFAGHIAQIDTSLCDSLVSGATQGLSCTIYLTYSGDAFTPDPTTFTFDFSWGQGPQHFKYQFVANNQILAEPNPAVINLLAEGNPALIHLASADNAGGTGLEYPIQLYNQFSLSNVGSSALLGNMLDPTLQVKVGTQFNSTPRATYEALDGMYTSCGADSIGIGTHCDFPFFYLTDDSKSSFLDLVFQYSENINYLHQVILSTGEFIPQDYYDQIVLQKAPYEDRDLGYSTPLANLTLKAKYEPANKLSLEQTGSEIHYAYGDFHNLNTAASYIGAELAADLSFSYDENCLISGYDPDYDQPGVAIRSCPVNYHFKQSNLKLDKPFAVNLYASYDSPTNTKIQMEQFVGTLLITDSEHHSPQDPSSLQCHVLKALTAKSLDIPVNSVMKPLDCYFISNLINHNIYKLLQSPNGSLQIYKCTNINGSCENKALWSSGLLANSAAYSQFFAAGNIETLVSGRGYFDKSATTVDVAYWVSHTSPQSGASFKFNDDGTLSILKDNNTLWSTAQSHGMMRCTQDGKWHPAEQCPGYDPAH